MLLQLTGVLEDGSSRAEGSSVPFNPRKSIAFPLGTSLTIRLQVVTSEGTPVVGGTVRLAAKKRASDGSPAFFKEVSPLAASVDFVITPTDTKSLEAGRYVYDVWHIAGDGARNAVVPLSPLWLEPAASLP